MMYGYGDAEKPYEETIELVEVLHPPPYPPPCGDANGVLTRGRAVPEGGFKQLGFRSVVVSPYPSSFFGSRLHICVLFESWCCFSEHVA